MLTRRALPLLLLLAADEIDAIGKARKEGAIDSGTQEREQGLLQLLTEMDGFVRDDQVRGRGAASTPLAGRQA